MFTPHVGRSQGGVYQVRLKLLGGWRSAAAGMGTCILLDRTVVIDEPEGFNTVWVLVGSLVGASIVVGLVFMWMRRWSAKLQACPPCIRMSSHSGAHAGLCCSGSRCRLLRAVTPVVLP